MWPRATTKITRVLVVDDSTFFRHRIADLLEQAPDLGLAGFAADGKEAVKKARELHPDVITMDIEMPLVDGITAVRWIMAECSSRILMFSAHTREGARETLDALDAGAVDFMPKDANFLAQGEGGNDPRGRLLELIRTVAHSQLPGGPRAGGVRQPPRLVQRAAGKPQRRPGLLAIGASTGGPMALQMILSALPEGFPLPLVVAVHMPGNFTTAFAQRLDSLCAIEVREAVDRQPLRPGLALIAPGGRQLLVERGVTGPLVRVRDALPNDLYHPSVDRLFGSVARSFAGNAMALILTGMGSDGLLGARALKAAGGRGWSQNEQSCVVYGMPHAVEQAGLSDRVLGLDEIGAQLGALA